MSKLGGHVCCCLQNEHEMFKDCHLLKTGSIYEEVKVGAPDEFDFMVILPRIAQPDYAVFEPSDNFQFLNWKFVKEAKKKEAVLFYVRQTIQELVVKLFKTNPQWELSNITKGFLMTGQNIAHTLQVVYNGHQYPCLKIDVDFCFSVPLKKIVETTVQFSPKGGSILVDTDETVYYILFNRYCRASFSCYEQKIVNQFSINSKPKCLLRVLKVLRDKYISKVFDQNSRTMSSLVSTYWLKTLLYKAIQETKCPICWEEKDLFEMIMKILQELYSIIQQGKLTSFFIPKYNLITKLSGQKSLRPGFSVTNHNYSLLTAEGKEKTITILTELNELMLNLRMLQTGNCPVHILQTLKDKEENIKKESNKILDTNLKQMLMEMLYSYAFNEYNDDGGLCTMKAFVKECLPHIELVGQDHNLVLKEHGKVVNIDKCLTDLYETDDEGKPFAFFPSSTP